MTLGKNRVHVLRFGEGPRLLVALHGFGDRARLFAALSEVLAGPYTVVAVDLPFHGQTDWQGRTFGKEDLLEIIQEILKQEGVARFSLMGFSFGARLAKAMLPELADRLDKLILLSPDGFNTKGMGLAVQTPYFMRHFLFRTLQRPHWFLMMLKAGRKVGVVPPLIQHFLSINLTRADRFQRTFGFWFALNSFRLPIWRFKSIMRRYGVPVDVYYGKKDAMIRMRAVRRALRGLPNARLIGMDEGHRVVGDGLTKLWS